MIDEAERDIEWSKGQYVKGKSSIGKLEERTDDILKHGSLLSAWRWKRWRRAIDREIIRSVG